MRRFAALSLAEARQFFRNVLLVFTAPFPILLAVAIVLVESSGLGVAVASAGFFLISLGFVVYYSALSMATTRRDEKVLKRLRTGEALDWEILTSISVPLTALVVVTTPVTIALVNSLAADSIGVSNPAYIAIALVLGIPVAHGLALLTSRVTRNAEAAAISSLPILIVMVLSFPVGLRQALPEALGRVVEWNPFALAADLFNEGWIGGTVGQPAATIAALAAWAVVIMWAGMRWMRWETHR